MMIVRLGKETPFIIFSPFTMGRNPIIINKNGARMVLLT